MKHDFDFVPDGGIQRNGVLNAAIFVKVTYKFIFHLIPLERAWNPLRMA